MATDYPIEITDPDGSVRIAGLADFIDPSNAPAGTNQPFQPPPDGIVVVVENSGGDPVYTYDEDASSHEFVGSVSAGAIGCDSLNGTLVDGAGLGSGFPYVAVQSGAPSTYLTPLVFDSTAVTGGLYAWDGAAYQNVGGPL